METMNTTKIEATSENVLNATNAIKKFAEEKGYQIIGEFKKDSFLSTFIGSKLKFESKSQEKVLRNYLTRFDKRPGMAIANKLLHFLYKKVYKTSEPAPRVEYSERELKIKALRKEWRKLMAETEKARLAYKEMKGDFYKK